MKSSSREPSVGEFEGEKKFRTSEEGKKEKFSGEANVRKKGKNAENEGQLRAGLHLPGRGKCSQKFVTKELSAKLTGRTLVIHREETLPLFKGPLPVDCVLKGSDNGKLGEREPAEKKKVTTMLLTPY